MIQVEVNEKGKGSFEKALFTFRKKVENSRILEEYLEKQYYLKPSLLKRQRRMKNARYKNSGSS